jgi:hypothetical protein
MGLIFVMFLWAVVVNSVTYSYRHRCGFEFIKELVVVRTYGRCLRNPTTRCVRDDCL